MVFAELRWVGFQFLYLDFRQRKVAIEFRTFLFNRRVMTVIDPLQVRELRFECRIKGRLEGLGGLGCLSFSQGHRGSGKVCARCIQAGLDLFELVLKNSDTSLSGV